ncbi:hypothetical protein KAR91_41990 [Candidatus Pacearchaeota archaeon]|nr:hypothetical protein [Candidatus Pacearchaeota archaeon]
MSTLDSQLILADTQDINSGAGTVVGESVVYIPRGVDHTGTAENDRPNVSDRLHLNVLVEGTDLLAAVDGCVLTIALMNDTDDVPTTGGDVIITQDFTVDTPSNYPAGTQLMSVALPQGQLKEYYGILFTIATQTLSTGTVTAWIGPAIQQGK